MGFKVITEGRLACHFPALCVKSGAVVMRTGTCKTGWEILMLCKRMRQLSLQTECFQVLDSSRIKKIINNVICLNKKREEKIEDLELNSTL